MIATLVRQLAEEGLGPVTVVTGYLAEQVEALLEGLDVQFARQPVRTARRTRSGAPSPAAQRCRRWSAQRTPCFAPAISAASPKRFTASGAAGAIAYFRGSGPVAIRVEDDHVQRVVDSEPGELSPAPLWGLTDEIRLDELPGPPFELAEAFQRAIDAGRPIAAIEIGRTRQLTAPADLVRENFPYLGGT